MHDRFVMRTSRLKLLIQSRVAQFLFVFTIGLILGDGKGVAIDIYWLLITLITIPVWRLGTQKYLTITSILWTMYILTALVGSVISWNPGYSIVFTIRLLVAFVWFERFRTIRQSEVRDFILGLATLSIILLPVTFLFLLFPELGVHMPPLNLLVQPAGHLPVAYIALPLLPILYTQSKLSSRPLVRIAFWSSVITVFMSFSRGALPILAAFLLVIARSAHQRFRRIILATLGTLSLALLLYILVAPAKGYPYPQPLRRFIEKDAVWNDPRIAYIQEAWSGFTRSPLLGTGPGTYYWVSQQFARTPDKISLNTENVVFQRLAEGGFAGSLPLLALIIAAIFAAYTAAKQSGHDAGIRLSFFISLLLTAVLGLIETNTERYAILIFSGISLSVLTAKERRLRLPYTNTITALCLCIIAIFTITWLTSDVSSFLNRPDLGFYAAPYRKDKSIQFLRMTSRPLSIQEKALITHMFPHDATIAVAMASRSPTTPEGRSWYQRAIREDPTNLIWQRDYFVALLMSHDLPLFCTELRRLTDIPELDCPPDALLSADNTNGFIQALGTLITYDGRAKFLYHLGLSYVRLGNDASAIPLWNKAKDASPNWSYYHLELASLIAHYNHDEAAAIPTLRSCLTSPAARASCEYYLHHVNTLHPPGAYARDIDAIPTVIVTKDL